MTPVKDPEDDPGLARAVWLTATWALGFLALAWMAFQPR
jgi:hypothetical protein